MSVFLRQATPSGRAELTPRMLASKDALRHGQAWVTCRMLWRICSLSTSCASSATRDQHVVEFELALRATLGSRRGRAAGR